VNPVPDHTATTPSVKDLLTSGVVTACFYALRPQDRPCCEGLGVVRYGPTTLCADCDRRRSAVGKGTAPLHLPDPGALLEILAAQHACRQAALVLRQAVSSARRAGQPWSAIGTILGTTRQAAQQRFDEPAVGDRHPRPHSLPAVQQAEQKEVTNRS
jgi:hypothetical protein